MRVACVLAALVVTACGVLSEPTEPEEPDVPGAASPHATETSEVGPGPGSSIAPAPPPTATSPDAGTPGPPPPGAPALRGVWIHLFDDTLKTPRSIDVMLDRVAAAGANTAIAEVVRRQDAYYDSAVLPRTPDPALAAGFDALAHLAEGAAARGLALHAWVPLMPTTHHVYDDLAAPPGWVSVVHGAEAPVEQRWVTRLADGTWTDYLDPGVPAVRDHVVAVMTEIASRYDVDAVHLDYLRYPAADAGYHPIALERFRAATGRDDIPPPEDPGWSRWRREQVTTLLADIRAAVAAAAPTVAVSAAVIAQGDGPDGRRPFSHTRAFGEYHQDWPAWVRAGLVDAVMPMNYAAADTATARFAQWLAFARGVAAESEVVVAPGIGAWLNPLAAARTQLEASLEATDGAVIYSYQQSATTSPGLLDTVGDGLWREPVPPPDLR